MNPCKVRPVTFEIWKQPGNPVDYELLLRPSFILLYSHFLADFNLGTALARR
jgi:hypothetical protein